MPDTNNIFISKVYRENSEIDIELLSGILSPIHMTPEFTGVKNIIDKLFDAHEVALTMHWPDSEDKSLRARFEVLSDVRKTDVYKSEYHTDATNPFDNKRVGDFPFAALFTQPFNIDISKKQKHVLLLFVLMLYQVLQCDENDQSTLYKVADLLRKLVKRADSKYECFTFTTEGIDYQYGDLLNLLEKVCEVKELRELNKLTSFWKTLTLSFSSNAVEDDLGHSEILDNKSFSNINEINGDLDINDVSVPDQKGINDYNRFGSRLNLNELLHLPWRANVLAKHEIDESVKFLLDGLNGENTRRPAIVAFLVMLTSKPFQDVQNIKVYSKGSSCVCGDYIDLSRGEWVRENCKMPDSFTRKEGPESYLTPHSQRLHLPLPSALIEAIRSLVIESGEFDGLFIAELCKIDEPVSSLLSTFLKPLWKNNTVIHRRITPASLRAVMFEQLAHKYDGAFASLILANTEYDNPTSLYYISGRASLLVTNYQSILNDMGLDTKITMLTSDKRVGSELVIDTDKIKPVIIDKSKHLVDMLEKDSSQLNYEELILRHNEFSCYISSMLIASTGARTRDEYGFSPFAWDEEGGYILLSDKVNYEESAVRILPMSSMVIQQLTAFKSCCKDTARRIKAFNPLLSEKLSTIANASSCEWPLISYIEGGDLQSVILEHIQSYLGDTFNLPMNCFRHFFSGFLHEKEEFTFAKTMMGHVNYGEHILSNHSCASFVDIKESTYVIDALLDTLGFKYIDYKKPLGPKIVASNDFEKKSYRAKYLYRNEKKERSGLITWAKKTINPHLDDLTNNNTFEATRELLFDEAKKNTKLKSSKPIRLSWLNKVMKNILRNDHFNLINNMKHIDVGTNTLLRMRQSKTIKSALNDLILENEIYDGDSQLVKIFMSLVINSGVKLSLTSKNLKVIQNSPYFENGIAWFDFYESNKIKKRVVIDSLTLLLIMKSSNYTSVSIVVNKLNSLIENEFLSLLRLNHDLDNDLNRALWSFDKLSSYIIDSRDENQSALTHAYQNNKFETTVLSPEKMTRWLSPSRVTLLSNQQNSSSAQRIINKLSTQSYFSHENTNFKKSEEFINTLKTALSRQNKIKEKFPTADLLIITWAKFINKSHETSIEVLVEHSSHISELAILLVLWAIKVAKTINKSNKLNAVMTPSDYLTYIAMPLLKQVRNINFLSMDSNELANVYKKAILAKNVKHRSVLAGRMRLFHKYLQQNFNFEPLDWYEIEPTISRNEDAVDENIISMNEYNKMLSILKNDESFSAENRDINQLILILCYRAGLRTGEACYLKINDIDTDNWIIHVRSYYRHRLKTGPSNRRIPISLLFSEAEKKLIIKQIERVKNYHLGLTDLWLFSDKINFQCLVNLAPKLTRVREVIRLASGDSSLKLRHARHSFANYLLMNMHSTYYSKNVKKELKNWSRSNDLQLLNEQFRLQFLDKAGNSKSVLHAVAMAMGHVNPQTTLKHYIHCLDIVLAAENEKCLFQAQKKHPSHPGFTKNSKHKIFSLLEGKPESFNKKLSRNKTELFGYQSLIVKPLESWDNFLRVVVCRKVEPVNLSTMNSNLEYQRVSELFDIEHVIRAAERGLSNVAITNRLHLDFEHVTRIVDAVIQLKLLIGYEGTNIDPDKGHIIFETNMRKLSTYSKFIRQPSFHRLLKQISKLLEDNLNAQTLVHCWQKSYKKNKGLVIPKDELGTFSELIRRLGYETRVFDEHFKVRLSSGYLIGVLIKFFPLETTSNNRQYGDNKVHHALFLLSIYLISHCQKTENHCLPI